MTSTTTTVTRASTLIPIHLCSCRKFLYIFLQFFLRLFLLKFGYQITPSVRFFFCCFSCFTFYTFKCAKAQILSISTLFFYTVTILFQFHSLRIRNSLSHRFISMFVLIYDYIWLAKTIFRKHCTMQMRPFI